MKTKEMKGITLIALVITVIVLLILAGITINALAGDNRITKKGNRSKRKNYYSRKSRRSKNGTNGSNSRKKWRQRKGNSK